MSHRSILIFGATGKQGGAVLRALLEHPSFSPTTHTILAVTRNPDSASAQRLADLSPAIKLIKGDNTKAKETFEALPTQPWGVYAMTTLPSKDETQQGVDIAQAAAKADVQRFVFSSVDRGPADECNSPSSVPHFRTKHEVEKVIRQLSQEHKFTHTIIRPPFFLDNLQPGFFGKVVATTWRDHCPQTHMAVVDTKDIGRLAALAFMDPENPKYLNKSLNIAGDRVTFAELDETFKQKTRHGIPTTYTIFPTLLLWLSADFAHMVKFWQDTGFAATPEESRNVLDNATTLDSWLDSSQHTKKQQ